MFSFSKTLRGGLIVGVVGAHWVMHGDLLEKVAGNHEKVGVFSSDAPLFPAALRVGKSDEGEDRLRRRNKKRLGQSGDCLSR